MNFAIIGYGKMGKLYDSLLGAKYIVDLLPVANRAYFSHVDEFIAYKQPADLAIVASPSHTHFEIVKKLLINNYNVLCEKPICLSSEEAEELEKLAEQKNLVLYQSTLERYNPLIKFFLKNIDKTDIIKIESHRYGTQPSKNYTNDPKFDLGIHDVDLWFYILNQKIPWQMNVGYGQPRREILVYLKNKGSLKLDLLNKLIFYNGSVLDFTKASLNNPILEMIYDLTYKGTAMNEKWSKEIKVLERSDSCKIKLNNAKI